MPSFTDAMIIPCLRLFYIVGLYSNSFLAIVNTPIGMTCRSNRKRKRLDAHNGSNYNNPTSAGVAESADAADLKSAGVILVGSSPTPGTTQRKIMPCLVGFTHALRARQEVAKTA